MKKILVVIGLMCLIGWGIYNHFFSSNEPNQNKQEAQAVSSKPVNAGIQERDSAVDFQLKSLKGEVVKLSDLKGKKVILNFWATWCPPCKAEMPHMQEFYHAQKGKNVEILAVNLTTAERNSSNISKFVKDYGLTFPVLLDVKGKIGETYQTFTIPTSYIIDIKGIIRKKIIGPMDQEMMTELINSID
ncbi:redoxin domain-containing protein [Neobacillus cucumis]|uniref:redoxin domain-containing protein n=1 Tax=Neobacillus cucumis TaxID=1740721 RepID=UPI001E3D9084|nr:redoxin domain-containing protein [Neobacillus cucumis]